MRLPHRTPTGWHRCLLGCALLGAVAASHTAAGEGEPDATARVLVPGLDLEIVATTSLRFTPEHTRTYAARLADVVRQLFDAGGGTPPGSPQPTYRVLVEHAGTIDLGATPYVLATRGRVFREGEFSGGEERRWFLRVKRDCVVRFSVMRRSGDAFVVPIQAVLKEPPTPDEETYGGVEIAAVVRTASDAKPWCPLSRDEARARALAAIVPPAQRLQLQIARQLVEVRATRIVPPTGSSGNTAAQWALLPADVTLANLAPWVLLHARVKTPVKSPRGRGLYAVEADLPVAVPPGKDKLVHGRASEVPRDEPPPAQEITELRWALK